MPPLKRGTRHYVTDGKVTTHGPYTSAAQAAIAEVLHGGSGGPQAMRSAAPIVAKAQRSSGEVEEEEKAKARARLKALLEGR